MVDLTVVSCFYGFEADSSVLYPKIFDGRGQKRTYNESIVSCPVAKGRNVGRGTHSA